MPWQTSKLFFSLFFLASLRFLVFAYRVHITLSICFMFEQCWRFSHLAKDRLLEVFLYYTTEEGAGLRGGVGSDCTEGSVLWWGVGIKIFCFAPQDLLHLHWGSFAFLFTVLVCGCSRVTGSLFFFFFCRIIPFCRPSPSLYPNILSEGLSSAIIFSVQSWTSTLPLFTISFLFLSPLSTLCLCLSLVSVECKPQRFSAKIICCPHA